MLGHPKSKSEIQNQKSRSGIEIFVADRQIDFGFNEFQSSSKHVFDDPISFPWDRWAGLGEDQGDRSPGLPVRCAGQHGNARHVDGSNRNDAFSWWM